MYQHVLFALYFLLPAAAANVTPIIVSKLPVLKNFNAPIDGGKTFKGKQLFGPHKTWRGIIAGVVVASIIFGLQKQHGGIALNGSGVLDYATLPLILGPLFGLGALGGDALESFFKRQRGIKSGKAWVPFDQLDYIVGGVLISLPFIRLSPVAYLYIGAVWFIVHLVASYVGYMTGFKKYPI